MLHQAHVAGAGGADPRTSVLPFRALAVLVAQVPRHNAQVRLCGGGAGAPRVAAAAARAASAARGGRARARGQPVAHGRRSGGAAARKA